MREEGEEFLLIPAVFLGSGEYLLGSVVITNSY